MDKRTTVASAHTRIDTIEPRVTKLEVQLEERWQQNLYRLKRLEGFLLTGMAATLMLLITLILK